MQQIYISDYISKQYAKYIANLREHRRLFKLLSIQDQKIVRIQHMITENERGDILSTFKNEINE